MSTIKINLNEVPKGEMLSHSRNLLDVVAEYFENSEVQKDYENWHLEKYGFLPQNASYTKKQ